jgi:hypothetical protein
VQEHILNPITYSEKIVSDFLRYQLTKRLVVTYAGKPSRWVRAPGG